MASLSKIQLGGHDVQSEAWTQDISDAAKRCAANYREPLTTDGAVREFVEWEKQKFVKRKKHFSGPIAAGYFKTPSGHWAQPEDSGSGEREVRLDLANGTNSDILRIPQAFPIYWYEIDGTQGDSVFVECTRIRRRSLPPTLENTEWIVRHVLQYNREYLDAIFIRATGVSFSDQEIFRPGASPTHSDVYDHIRFSLEKYGRIVFEETNHKKDTAFVDLRETFEKRSTKKNKSTKDDKDDKDNEKHEGGDSDFIHFASHPESIRYFGAGKFADLAEAYDEIWLMGLSLESLEELHEAAYANPYSICFPHTMPRRICSKKHIYASKLEFNARISEASMGAFVAICKKQGTIYDQSAYVELAVYCALKFHVAIFNHTYSDFQAITSAINFHEGGLFAQRLIAAFDNCEADCFLPDNILGALARLMQAGAIYVHCPEGDFVHLHTAGEDIGMRKDLRIYLRSVYESEAMFVSSIYQVYRRFQTAQALGLRLTDKVISGETAQQLCSEQRFLIENLERQPVINAFGPGGAGKTFALKALHELLGDEILYLGFQNRHVKNLARTFKGRCSTIHKIFTRHPYFCQKTINDYTNEPDVYHTLLNIFLARQAENLVAAARAPATSTESSEDDDETGLEKRVWCACTSCPLENLQVVCFEEVSTINLHLCAVVLSLLLRCAPRLRLVIFAGDHRQLPSMSFGNLIHDLSQGLGIFEFRHTHRSRALSLRLNAELLAQDDRPLEFDNPLPIENEPHVLLESALNEKTALYKAIAELIKRRDLTSLNCQFITRTHEVRKLCGNFIRNTLLGLAEEVRGGVFQGQKIMFSHGSLGPIGTGEIRIAWCVVHVDLEVVSNRDRKSIAEQYAKTSEIVSASLMLDARDGDMPQNVGEIIDRVADGELQLPDALNPITNTRSRRREYLSHDWIPVHPDLLRILRNGLSKKAKSELGRLVDLECLRVRFVQLSSNSSQQTSATSSTMGYTQKIIACFPLDSKHAPQMPTISLNNLRKLVLDNEVQFMPYTGAERGNVVDASLVTVSAMQGSSAPTIVDIKIRPSRFDYKSCLYTAVTRAEDYYIALGDGGAFRQAAKNQDPERKSDLAKTLATLHAAFVAQLPSPDYTGAAMLELSESQDPSCLFFAYLSCHPKPFLRAYSRQIGAPNKLKLASSRLADMAHSGPSDWKSVVCIQKPIHTPPSASLVVHKAESSDADMDYLDGLDDDLFEEALMPFESKPETTSTGNTCSTTKDVGYYYRKTIATLVVTGE